jgi:16S rRNA (guanine527-N7)-methyltransferase
VDEHVADSLSGLAVEGLREADTIADLGSGAGFPGLPLALALPAARVDLVEASARKCELIARLASAAGASNARALALRAEQLGAGEGQGAYAVVTARALAPLAVLVEYAAPLLRPEGALVAWKGARSAEEEAAGERAGAAVGLEAAEVITVAPFAHARARHLHVFAKTAPTPARFPRRPGVARKRPLA